MNTTDTTTAVAVRTHQPAPVSLGGGRDPNQLRMLAEVVAEATGGNPRQAMMQLALAESVGLSLGQALNDVHVIKGKPTLSANVQLAIARRAGVRTRWVVSTDTEATLRLWVPGDPDPVDETFTIDDAKRAGLANGDGWRKYPKAMLRARVSAAAIRAHCPEVLGGTVYDPDELRTIDAQPVEAVDVTPARTHDDERHPGVKTGGRLLTGEERARIQDAIGDVLTYVEDEIGAPLEDWTTAEARLAKPVAERIRHDLAEDERRALAQDGEE